MASVRTLRPTGCPAIERSTRVLGSCNHPAGVSHLASRLSVSPFRQEPPELIALSNDMNEGHMNVSLRSRKV